MWIEIDQLILRSTRKFRIIWSTASTTNNRFSASNQQYSFYSPHIRAVFLASSPPAHKHKNRLTLLALAFAARFWCGFFFVCASKRTPLPPIRLATRLINIFATNRKPEKKQQNWSPEPKRLSRHIFYFASFLLLFICWRAFFLAVCSLLIYHFHFLCRSLALAFWTKPNGIPAGFFRLYS